MKELANWVAGILFVAAFVPYIRAILRKETKPAKASWLIWATLDTITLAGMYSAGALNGQILGAVAGAWIVAGLAMKYGESGWSLLDKFCLAGAALGITLWQVYDNPVLGIVTSLGVVFVGAIPTFVSAWQDPSRENRMAWTIYWLSCVFALVAIPRWTLADASQPVVFFAVESIMMYILYIKR